MRKIIFIIPLIFEGFIFSCGNNKLYFREIVSEKYVTISMREEPRLSSLTLNVPIEFEIDLEPKNTSVSFHYVRNGEGVGSDENYLIYNGDTNKYIYKKGQWKDGSYYPKSIYLIDRTILLNKESAVKILEKCNIPISIETIKSNLDTIKLVPYSQFRKDFPDFIEEMRKEPDSLQMSIWFKSGKKVFVSQRINW